MEPEGRMKELIRMCDCEEIQGRWEIKAVDRVWLLQHNKFAHIVEIDGNLVIHDADVLKRRTWKGMKNETLYIPRIEDVLEWAEVVHMDFIGENKWAVGPKYHSGPAHYATTPLKGLLMNFMHLEHGKSWSGEAWV